MKIVPKGFVCLLFLFVLPFLSLQNGEAHAASLNKTARSIFDFSLEEVLRIQVRGFEVTDQFGAYAPVSVMNDSALQFLGIEFASDALSLISGIEISTDHELSFAIKTKKYGPRKRNVTILTSQNGRLSPLKIKGPNRFEDIYAEKIARIEVIRGRGAALVAPGNIDAVIVIVLKDSTLLEGGAET